MSLKFKGNLQEKVYSAMLNNLAYANLNGVLTGCEVTESSPNALTVEVASGRVFFGNDDVVVSAVSGLSFNSNSSSYDRVDLVVVDNNGSVSVVEGVANAIPMTPDYDPDLYIPFAIVTVRSGASEIVANDIKDIRVLNQGGAAGSGGSGGINRYTESFTGVTTINIDHNLADNNPVVQVYDSNGEQITPETVDVVSMNRVTITFSTATDGFVIVHGGLGGTAYYSESYTSSTTWNVQHNLGRKFVTVQCYDDNGDSIEPQNIELVDDNSLTVTFGTDTAGQVVVTGGASASEVVMNQSVISINAVAGENLVAGDVCYLNSDGKYWKADASSESTSSTDIVMSLGTISADSQGKFLVYGTYETSGLTTGDIYYISETSGQFTNTAPTTSTSIVRIIGYAYSDTKLLFKPDITYIENA